MRSRNSISVIFLILLLIFSFALLSGRRTVGAAETEFALIVRGGEGRELRLTLGEIAKLPRTSVRAKDEKGKDSLWEGAALHELLQAGGVKFGDAIRGKALENYLLVESLDGYRVLFALPELDPGFTTQTILLADRRDGQPLGEFEGKLRIVIPAEKRHGRWVRQVISLSIKRP
jgi:hypothetical protein